MKRYELILEWLTIGGSALLAMAGITAIGAFVFACMLMMNY